MSHGNGGAAPPAQRVRAQAGMELRLLARNAESLLVTLGIPVGLLVFFSLVDVLPTNGQPAVVFLLPGTLAIAVMGAAMVSLGIATGFERAYLVLKRLGATPLRRRELVTAKILAVLAVEVVQLLVLLGVALALGFRPRGAGSLWLLPVGLALGTAAFAGIGLAMAGRLRAVGTLAMANALFLVLLLASGLIFPLSALPGPMAAVAALLPAAPLAGLYRAALTAGMPAITDLAVLAAWAFMAPLLAAFLFRWE